MRKLIFFVCMVGVAVPSLAQDGSEGVVNRTPENAHKFLEKVMPTTRIAVLAGNSDFKSLPVAWKDVLKWSKIDGCTSGYEFAAHPGGVVETPMGKGTFPATPSGKMVMKWSRFTEVRQSGSDVSLANRDTPFMFRTPSETMAGRVANALQVVIDACDPTRESGF